MSDQKKDEEFDKDAKLDDVSGGSGWGFTHPILGGDPIKRRTNPLPFHPPE
jgi:hypothetical protein